MGPDRALRFGVQPGHEELGELTAALVEHTESAVAGAAEPRRRLDDPSQHVRQAEVARDHDHRVQQSASLVTGESSGRTAGSPADGAAANGLLLPAIGFRDGPGSR